MEKTFDIAAMGELLIDFTEYGYSEQNNRILEVCPGGAPCNVLAMLKKCGRSAAFIGKVGRDQFGDLLMDTVKSIGIETRGLMVDKEIHTTLAFVHTMPDGDREFSFYRNPGADIMLGVDELDKELIRSAKIFHFGTLSLTDEPVKSATYEAVKTAKEAGCVISFDPNLRPPLWKDLADAKAAMEYGISVCDVLKISDNEIVFLSGKEDYDEGIQYIIDRYHVPLIFLTMGKDGSRAYYKGKCLEEKGFSVKTVETTGAGDTFCACGLNSVLEYGIDGLDDKKLQDTLVFANAAAALVTTKKGAILSMPDLSEVETLIREN